VRNVRLDLSTSNEVGPHSVVSLPQATSGTLDENRQRGQIAEIFVFEPYREKGLAKILEFVDEKMKELRVRRIALHVFADNTATTELYRKHGYRVTDMNMHKWL
jgi:ribosomal protein S18 acetylase RimI-like enzyme